MLSLPTARPSSVQGMNLQGGGRYQLCDWDVNDGIREMSPDWNYMSPSVNVPQFFERTQSLCSLLSPFDMPDLSFPGPGSLYFALADMKDPGR